ncbi:MAG: hypothetical protein DHS20C01_31200 [marine bacterium B5-7]|nr:MAG: hypothetical protein DHS20C01_31200 [marine bacterium B5-7]
MSEVLEGSPEPQSLQQLLEHLVHLARMLNDWREGVGQATGFRGKIDKLIRANLAKTWEHLVAYYQASSERFSTISFNAADFLGFSAVWSPEFPELLSNPSDVLPDDSLFNIPDSKESPILAAYRRLESLFASLYRVFLEIIGLAPSYFARDLVGRHDHEPHFALFAAFLRLYRQVQNDANRFTQLHLEFFYENVLGIKRRPADPDKLHVLIELARQVKSNHRVSAGTELDAGKDETGVPLQYKLDEDLVANKAQIESFRTIFVKTVSVENDRTDQDAPDKWTTKRLFAAPVANSQDGLGAKIENSERPSWPTLGSTAMPEAILGFALASRALLLAEGTRTVTLKLQAKGVPQDLGKLLPQDALVAQLSGEKGWVSPDTVTVTAEEFKSTTVDGETVHTGTLKLVLKLESTAEAVTFANEKALGESYGTNDPLLKVTLRHPKSIAYGLLKDLHLQNVTLTTVVLGLTNLIVQNDQFAMDPGKPFEPFGPSPSKGSNFYVGSEEAFQKNLQSLKLDITWDDLPETFAKHYEGYDVEQNMPQTGNFETEVAVLQDGDWLPVGESQTKRLFDGEPNSPPEAKRTLDFDNLDAQQPRVIDDATEWTPATQHGFLRLKLNAPDQAFFHDQYVNVLTRQALAAGRFPKCTPGAKYRFPDGSVATCNMMLLEGEAIIPNAPYTPKIKSFKLDYEASIDTESTPDALSFFHLEPFGYRSVALLANGQSATTDGAAVTEPPLLPQFDHEGTLYLGLKDLEPLQSLSILFQVAEATADTDVGKPEVQWSYLTDDEWKAFKDFEITGDTTSDLTTSGVVTFSVPSDIAAKNPRLPSGLRWVRAAVKNGAIGVSELINAHTQAVRATFVDNGNDPKHLDTPLLAETVAGLVRDDAQVAGVTQPYDGFGGRPVETGLAFYTRVAEQLRHKGRSITLFDYERLVLERFPKIYKVKCVNHTNDKDEVAPGHVLIAVIPDFSQLKAVDRRAPKVTMADLDAIATFLQTINCPFARNDRGDDRRRLHVLNPNYEEIKVAFKVRFQPQVTAFGFYQRELNKAINEFLSPWAFKNRAEISFGGSVYKSSILHFVEQQPYVDFVTDFMMTHLDAEEDLDAIEATTPRSVLIPAEKHAIDLLSESDCPMTASVNLEVQPNT